MTCYVADARDPGFTANRGRTKRSNGYRRGQAPWRGRRRRRGGAAPAIFRPAPIWRRPAGARTRFACARRRSPWQAEGRSAARLLARRGVAPRLAPYPADHPAQFRRPVRAADRISLSQPVPRRPDRRPHPELADAKRNHRRRHRLLGDGGYRGHYDRPGKAAETRTGPILRRRPGIAAGPRILDQSRPGRPAASPPRLADTHARPHLRSRRLHAA